MSVAFILAMLKEGHPVTCAIFAALPCNCSAQLRQRGADR